MRPPDAIGWRLPLFLGRLVDAFHWPDQTTRLFRPSNKNFW